MDDAHVWTLRENVRYISILLLALLYIILETRLMLALLLSWIVYILILGNIRHLSRDNKLTFFLRTTLYFFPYMLPALFLISLEIKFTIQVLRYCFLAIGIFLVWLCINFKPIRISLSDVVIANTSKESKYVLFLRKYNLIGAAICEEFFFRGFILSLDAPITVLVPTSVLLFVLSHYILPWGRAFTNKDYVNQLVFGLISAAIFIFSGSILPCILLHLLFNSPTIIGAIRCYDRHYLRKKYFDKLILEKKRYIELDI